MIEAVAIVLAYLLGSVSGSLVLGRTRGVDIRTLGSGNAGGTNALRTQGLGFALGVVVIDVGKGALAVALARWLVDGATAPWIMAGAGWAAIFGHIYPVFHGFRGGKGAGTFLGALAVLAPVLLLPVFAVFAIVLIIGGYVGLSTILAVCVSFPASLWLVAAAGQPAMLVFTAGAAVLIVYAHRSNVQRLLAGTENRFERARFVNWRKRR